jgi:hypothetical protein
MNMLAIHAEFYVVSNFIEDLKKRSWPKLEQIKT